MIVVNGLKSCDTCRKARAWLKAEGIDARFHDVRGDGLEADRLGRWIAAVGRDVLINRRGTTWRSLDEAAKTVVEDGAAAALMLAHPALIKRPVFEIGERVLVGFDDTVREALKTA